MSISAEVPPAPASDKPAAKLIYAQKVRSAALAPSDPSPADRAIATDAGRMELEARQELAQAATSGTQLETTATQGRSFTVTIPDRKTPQQDVSFDQIQALNERQSHASATRVLLNRNYQAGENRNATRPLISLAG